MKKALVLLALAAALVSCQGKTAFKPKEKGSYAILNTSSGTIVFQLLKDETPKTVENFVALAQGKKEWTNPATGTKSTKPFYDGLTFHRVIKDFMIQGGDPAGDGTGGPGFEFADETYRDTDPITGIIQDEETAIQVWSQLIGPYALKNGTANETGMVTPIAEINKLINDVLAKSSGEPMYGKTVEYYQKLTGMTDPVVGKEIINPVAFGTVCMANSGPDTNGSQFFIVTAKDGAPWLDGVHTVFGRVVQGIEVAQEIEAVPVDENDKPVTPVTIKSVKIVVKK
jgi:peptidyl-prolyl cis-trans isomerase A (cyclophilin A)